MGVSLILDILERIVDESFDWLADYRFVVLMPFAIVASLPRACTALQAE